MTILVDNRGNFVTFVPSYDLAIKEQIKSEYNFGNKINHHISNNVREVPVVDGAHVQSSRAYAHVF